MEDRAHRIPGNEQAFQAINERLRDDLEIAAEGDQLVAFVCECGHASCHESVELTRAEYTAAHEREDQFVSLGGHVIPDVEDVVDRTDRYVVVRKTAP